MRVTKYVIIHKIFQMKVLTIIDIYGAVPCENV